MTRHRTVTTWAVWAWLSEMEGMNEEALGAFQSTPPWQERVPRAWTVVREMQAMHQLHGVIPDCRIAELQDQGHMAHLRAPELLANEVARFLATIADK